MAKIINITKTINAAKLADVPLEKRFWCYDGKVLQNLTELKSALETMSDDDFHYHLGWSDCVIVGHSYERLCPDLVGL